MKPLSKKQKIKLTVRRFFRRFNPWLFLICVLLALVIFCAAMYVKDPTGLRPASAALAAMLYSAV